MMLNGDETEYEAVSTHLFYLLEMPFIYEFDTIGLAVRVSDTDDAVRVFLECEHDNDDKTARYMLYEQHGPEAQRKCLACTEYLRKQIVQDSLRKHEMM